MIVLDSAALPNNLNDDELSWSYNGLDVTVTRELHDHIIDPEDPTYNFSISLQVPVLEMMCRGLYVDRSRQTFLRAKLSEQKARLQRHFDEICKDAFSTSINWLSPKQLSVLFFDILRLPRADTTDRKTLERLSIYYPTARIFVEYILGLRDLAKKIAFLSTPLDSDGRIRCSYNIAGTRTGRFSSNISDFGTGTNLQNIDRDLREIFVAPPGRIFCNVDLEQADSRNLGAICWNLFRDGTYLDVCESGDLHSRVASIVWPDLDLTRVHEPFYRGKSRRDVAKSLGHGTNYGGNAVTMADNTKIPLELVRVFQAKYLEAFACIPAWWRSVEQTLQRDKTLTTPLGRSRRFWGRLDQRSTFREALAFGPQSMTADEINTVLLAITRHPEVHVHAQVHDSILFSVPENKQHIAIDVIEKAQFRMELAGGRLFSVPLESSFGWNWGKKSDQNPRGLVKWKHG